MKKSAKDMNPSQPIGFSFNPWLSGDGGHQYKNDDHVKRIIPVNFTLPPPDDPDTI